MDSLVFGILLFFLAFLALALFVMSNQRSHNHRALPSSEPRNVVVTGVCMIITPDLIHWACFWRACSAKSHTICLAHYHARTGPCFSRLYIYVRAYALDHFTFEHPIHIPQFDRDF